MHPHIHKLIRCLEWEEKEQIRRFHADGQTSLKKLKAEGVALHPIRITGKGFGWADYPEFSFRLPYPPESHLFKDNAAIELISSNEEPVKGILLSLSANTGEVRLFSSDLPDWLEDGEVAIKLSPDTRTTSLLINRLKSLENNAAVYRLFNKIHPTEKAETIQKAAAINESNYAISFTDKTLNESQKNAVKSILSNDSILIVHGPPGTGKTTTLTEAILQLIKEDKKVIISAPSNAATDHLALQLVVHKVKLLRVGNNGKAHAKIEPFTPEGQMQQSREFKEIKELKKRAEEFRRMALKYKRQFGKEEREQRQLLFAEVKAIRKQIKQQQDYLYEKMYADAQVIAGTPVALIDAGINNMNFDTLFLDEAGQCLEPMAWSIFHLADRIVVSGDHLQLPPTVLSEEALRENFNVSILEKAIEASLPISFLEEQYRMRENIAGFSNAYFYKGRIKTTPILLQEKGSIIFIDTAGSGFEEEPGQDGISLQNSGEMKLMQKITESEQTIPHLTAFISPYSAQITLAKNMLTPEYEISTIDSFQGREKHTILLSLVRSNTDGEIGFLKDYRRMNVAITRAKQKLIIIGDSSTIGNDRFYSELIAYIEKNGEYKTCWDYPELFN